MTVRAKLYLESIEHRTWGTKACFRVVSPRGDDNKEWAAATPAGEMWLTIKNEKAAAAFTLDQLGQEFFVDITPVPEELQGQEGMAAS